MKILTIGSGSTGNATLISSKTTNILIDCGLAAKNIIAAAATNLGAIAIAPLHAIFISHEHSDHIKGAGALARKTGATVHINQAVYTAKQSEFTKCSVVFFEAGVADKVGDLTITPFSTKHDSLYSVGFVISDGVKSIGYLTDTGSISRVIEEALKNCDVLFIETDYDDELLDAYDGYDELLKDRIRSSYGHLSNKQAIEFISTLDLDKRTAIILGHLSPRTNSQDKITEMVKTAFPNHVNKFHIAPLTGPLEL